MHNARIKRLNNPAGGYDQILSAEDWQRLLSLTYTCGNEAMKAIPPSLAGLLYAGDDDVFHVLDASPEMADEAPFRNKLNALFTDALSIVPDSARFLSLLKQAFGEDHLTLDGAKVVIESLEGARPEKKQFLRKKKTAQPEAIRGLRTETERALLLSVLPEAGRKSSDEIIGDILPQGFARYKKILILIHELHERPEQRLINKILDDYEHAPWERWEEVYRLDARHPFLDEDSKEALPVILVLSADTKRACKYIADFLGEEVPVPAKLASTLASADISLTRKALTLFYAVFCGTCGATDTLSRTVTALDREVESSDDLRLQWLFACSALRLTGDRALYIRVRERIFRLNKEGKTERLVPPFIVHAMRERNRISRQTLSEQITHLFGNNLILGTWIRLLDAWQEVGNNTTALGAVPACRLEPKCTTEDFENCSPDSSGRDGFFCLMRREFQGNANGMGATQNLFTSFLSMIEKRAKGVPTEEIVDTNDNAAKPEETNELKDLKEFLAACARNGNDKEREKEPEIIQVTWDDHPRECSAFLDRLLSENPDWKGVHERRDLLQDGTPEAIARLDKVFNLSVHDRVTELLKVLARTQEPWPDEAVERVLSRAKELSEAGSVGIKESMFSIAYLSALVEAGRIEEALSQIEKVTGREMAMPNPGRDIFMVDICKIFGKMASTEQARYLDRIKAIFQKAKYFEISGYDFEAGDFGKIELLREILQVFKWRKRDEDIALKRIGNVERKKLFHRMKQDGGEQAVF